MYVHILCVFPWRALAGAQEDGVEPFPPASGSIPQGLCGSGGQASSPCVWRSIFPRTHASPMCWSPGCPLQLLSDIGKQRDRRKQEERQGSESHFEHLPSGCPPGRDL